MQQENTVGDQTGEQNKMINEIIPEFDRFQIRQAEHNRNRTHQIEEGVMIERGKFGIDDFIRPTPVEQNTTDVYHQPKG